MDIAKFICEVTRLPGVSGNEFGVNKAIAEAFKPVSDDVEIDRMQNVIARVGERGPKVMIAAHQDEIGLVVTKIEADGSLRIARNGGVDPRILPGMEVEIQSRRGPVYGVIGALPPHLQQAEDKDKAVKFTQLFVDIGYPPEQVREMVRVGDSVVMLAKPQMLADGAMACKTMDDRAGVAAMLIAAEALRRMRVDAQVYFVAATQEEVGSYGAMVAAYGIHPDFAIAIDVTQGEGPGTGKWEAHPLDKIVIDRGPVVHPKLGRKLEAVAKKHYLPYEVAACGSLTYTDADVIQTARGGIPSALLSIPLRYMHTTVETLRTDTVRDAGRLMALMIAEMAEEWEGFVWY